MSYEDTFLDGMIGGTYDIINSLNTVEFFGMGAFNWLVVFFVAGFAVELLRHILGGGSDNGK